MPEIEAALRDALLRLQATAGALGPVGADARWRLQATVSGRPGARPGAWVQDEGAGASPEPSSMHGTSPRAADMPGSTAAGSSAAAGARLVPLRSVALRGTLRFQLWLQTHFIDQSL